MGHWHNRQRPISFVSYPTGQYQKNSAGHLVQGTHSRLRLIHTVLDTASPELPDLHNILSFLHLTNISHSHCGHAPPAAHHREHYQNINLNHKKISHSPFRRIYMSDFQSSFLSCLWTIFILNNCFFSPCRSSLFIF